MLRRATAGLGLAACLVVAPAALDCARGAEVVISINKAKQSMSVLIDGAEAYNWAVSTGVGGGPYDGTYRPGRMERKWASRKYNMAPMPYAIFFDGNYAIHGTVKIAQLGRRASKGCVRLHPRDAAVLFALVGREKANTTIVVDKATHVAARPMPVKSDAPAVEAAAVKAGPAKVEPAKLETTAAAPARPEAAQPEPAKLEIASAAQPTAVAAVSSRPRKIRPNSKSRLSPFRANYGSIQ